MSKINDIARSLFGRTRLEETATIADATTYTVIGLATSDSANGMVKVHLTDDVTSAEWDDETGTEVEIPTNVVVFEGQRVYVSIWGGTVSQMVVTGVVGQGDAEHQRLVAAEEAGEVALATNQHFWTDTNGAHVTDDDLTSWDTEYKKSGHGSLANPTDQKPWHNILLNSLGILLRRGLINLVSITKSAVAFYDGTGNGSENITASFGSTGAQIGKSTSQHAVLGSSGLSVYNSDGSLAAVNGTLDGANLVNASVTGAKIDASTFTDGQISGSKITDSSITASQIANSTITATQIADSTITSTKIQNGTITGTDIASATITGSNIASSSVTGSNIDASTFTNGQISGSAIDSSTLTNIPYASIANADLEVARVADAEIAAATIHIAQIDDLAANYAHVTNGVIDTATIGHASVNGLSANYAHLSNGVIDNATIGYADVNGLSANYAHITDGVIDTAKIGYADINGLSANYAQINLANVNNSWITNGTIKNAAISDAQIIGVSANKLTAGTIDASQINVSNLRADSLIVNKINGQPILGGYVAVDSTASGYASKNPKTQGWYEIQNGSMVATNDTTVNASKAYYTTSTSVALYDQTYIDGLETTLNNRIDGAIETFTGTVVPTLTNYPYTDWYDTTTSPVTDNRAEHVGDIYYVVNEQSQQDGYCYRFTYDNTTSSYSWVLIKDSDVTAALSDITDLQTFQSDTTSWMNETDEGLTTIRQNHTSLSGVVDKAVKASTQLWFTKANETAPSAPNAQVTSTATTGNAWTTVVPVYNVAYPYYFYCWQYKLVDDTYTWSAVINDKATAEAQERARTGVANAATAQGTANANIKSSVQLWMTKANDTAPNKPSSVVSSTATSANTWTTVVPVYSSTYPYYFYCYQQQKGDGTYQWTDVVYDQATSEAMKKAQEALPASTFTTFQSTTFKEVTDTVGEQATSITNMSTVLTNNGLTSSTNISNTVNTVSQTASSNSSKISNITTALGTNADGTTKAGDIIHRTSSIEQDVSGIRTTITSVESTQTNMQTALDATIKERVTLWCTAEDDGSTPLPPNLAVGNSLVSLVDESGNHLVADDGSRIVGPVLSSGEWSVTIPDYDSSKPRYFYCHQDLLTSGSYKWGEVVYDPATSDAQANGIAATSGVYRLTMKTNEISDTVDGHTSKLTSVTETQEQIRSSAVSKTVQLWFTKADTTAPSSPTSHVTTNSASTVNAWNLAVPTYSESYPNYFYCYEYEYVDGTYGWSSVTRDIATGESQQQARQGVSDAATAKGVADKNVRASQQLWYTKSNSTAPSKPGGSSPITSTSTSANTWTTVVPTYDPDNSNYFYCMQYVAADNTVSWSDVIYDRATTEAQDVARSVRSDYNTFVNTTYANYVETTELFKTQVGQTYATNEALSGVSGRVTNNESSITQLSTSIESVVANSSTYIAPDGTTKTNALYTAISQNAGAITLKADASSTYNKAEVDNLVGDAIDDASDLVYDHEWTLSDGTYVFTASLRKAGVSVASDYAPECFVWYLRGEDGDELWSRGLTASIPESAAGLRSNVLGGFYVAEFKILVDEGGNALVDENGNRLLALMPE